VKRKVASIVCDHSNSQMAIPFAYALLTCKHSAEVKIVPTVYYCVECGRETTSPSKCPCDTRGGFKVKYRPNPHRAVDQLTYVGDEVECERCDWYADKLAQLRALSPGDIQHARFRPTDSRGGIEGSFYAYVRDPGSPSGVKLLLSIEATKEAEEVLSALRAAPLSPTEPR
jgi:hypothetical protein